MLNVKFPFSNSNSKTLIPSLNLYFFVTFLISSLSAQSHLSIFSNDNECYYSIFTVAYYAIKPAKQKTKKLGNQINCWGTGDAVKKKKTKIHFNAKVAENKLKFLKIFYIIIKVNHFKYFLNGQNYY